MDYRLVLLFVLYLPLYAWGATFERDFAVVMVKQTDEKKYGRFPFDRSLYARAIERAADAGAKGVVFKFFLDRAATSQGDLQLVQAMGRLPVLLQARLDEAEVAPNPLDDRFTLTQPGLQVAVEGASGWIPLPQFADKAYDVCFVDFNASPVPLVETYKGKTVKSLLLCAAEMALGGKAVIRPARDVTIAHRVAVVDAMNRTAVTVAPPRSLAYYDFRQLLDGRFPKDALRNRVVIIAYDGNHIAKVDSPVGTMGAHRLFVLMLKGFYENLSATKLQQP